MSPLKGFATLWINAVQYKKNIFKQSFKKKLLVENR